MRILGIRGCERQLKIKNAKKERQTATVVQATVLGGGDGTFAVSRLAFHISRQKADGRNREGLCNWGFFRRFLNGIR